MVALHAVTRTPPRTTTLSIMRTDVQTQDTCTDYGPYRSAAVITLPKQHTTLLTLSLDNLRCFVVCKEIYIYNNECVN